MLIAQILSFTNDQKENINEVFIEDILSNLIYKSILITRQLTPSPVNPKSTIDYQKETPS